MANRRIVDRRRPEATGGNRRRPEATGGDRRWSLRKAPLFYSRRKSDNAKRLRPTAATRGRRRRSLCLPSFVLYFPTRKSTGTPTRDLGFGRELAFCVGSALLASFARRACLVGRDHQPGPSTFGVGVVSQQRPGAASARARRAAESAAERATFSSSLTAVRSAARPAALRAAFLCRKAPPRTSPGERASSPSPTPPVVAVAVVGRIGREPNARWYQQRDFGAVVPAAGFGERTTFAVEKLERSSEQPTAPERSVQQHVVLLS